MDDEVLIPSLTSILKVTVVKAFSKKNLKNLYMHSFLFKLASKDCLLLLYTLILDE